jgi:hypothetical protein
MELKFTAERRPRKLDRIAQRRKKLVANIDDQIARLAEPGTQKSSGGDWFWPGEDGKYYLSIKYGRTDIELTKGMFSVECADLTEVNTALEKIREMVLSGKLDDALQKASDALRAKFKRS